MRCFLSTAHTGVHSFNRVLRAVLTAPDAADFLDRFFRRTSVTNSSVQLSMREQYSFDVQCFTECYEAESCSCALYDNYGGVSQDGKKQ